MSTRIFNVRASENQCANKTTTNHHCQIYEQTVVRGQCVAWLKRLEQGTFSWPAAVDPAQTKLALAPQALAMLTDGIDLRGAKMRPWYEREPG